MWPFWSEIAANSSLYGRAIGRPFVRPESPVLAADHHARRTRPPQNPPLREADRNDRPGALTRRNRHAADRRVARARPRQAHALALHRLQGDARLQIGETIAEIFRADNPQATADQIAFEKNAPGARAACDRGGEPRRAACENPGMGAADVVRRRGDESRHAAHAQGYVASWLTEWYAYDRRVLDALGLAPHERITGFVHIGRPSKPPEDRPRPPLSDIVTHFG